ncbi:hypothetical protein KY332_00065 [Candidatus Woesearchaeota archaeon]|nr:hypothetical protein [Candidatus Woesearchaeota archaeon]
MKSNYNIKGLIKIIEGEKYKGLKNLKDKKLMSFDSFTNALAFEGNFMEYYRKGHTPAEVKRFPMKMMFEEGANRENKPLDHNQKAYLEVKDWGWPIVERYMEIFSN